MSDLIYVDKIDEVKLCLSNLTESQFRELKDFFSFRMKNFYFHPKFKAGNWNGMISYFDFNDQSIPIGLLPQFIKFCKQYGYKFKLNFDKEELYDDISEEQFEEFYKAIFKDTQYWPRDYQDESIKKALRYRKGIIESATGSGKSLMLYCIIRFLLGLEARVLLIVPNVSLVNQMFSDFQDYGWDDAETYTSTIFDGSKRINWNMPVIISTWQSIYKKTENFFKCFDAILIDEVHGINDANSLQKCLKKATKAVYRIGTTGTIPDEIERKFAMFGYLGPLLFQQKSMELIEKGILSKIAIVNILLKYPVYLVEEAKQAKLDKNYDKELDIIYKCKDRNPVAFDFIFKNVNPKHNVLVLCKEIEHLKEVKEFIEKRYKKEVFLIYGKVDGDTREEIRVGMEDKEGAVIVGTYKTMSTGINIKKIHHVVFAASYKSKITILQAIGRGLRTHESKDKLILWDIVDDLSWHSKFGDRQILHKNYVFDHWWLRLDFYKAQGFKYVTKILNINNSSDSYLQELS